MHQLVWVSCPMALREEGGGSCRLVWGTLFQRVVAGWVSMSGKAVGRLQDGQWWLHLFMLGFSHVVGLIPQNQRWCLCRLVVALPCHSQTAPMLPLQAWRVRGSTRTAVVCCHSSLSFCTFTCGRGYAHQGRRWWSCCLIVGFPPIHEWCGSSKDGSGAHATSAGLWLVWLGFFRDVQAARTAVSISSPRALLSLCG